MLTALKSFWEKATTLPYSEEEEEEEEEEEKVHYYNIKLSYI